MTQIRFVFITLIAFLIFSCEKEDVRLQEETESLFPISSRTSKSYDAQINIQASMYHSISLLPRSVSISSFFMDSQRQPLEIGDISVEGIKLERGTRVPQYNVNANDLSGDTLETFALAFQNKAVSIELDGGQSVFPDFDTIVPLPSMVVFDEPIDSINKSEPLTLSWKNAGDNTKEPVGILITYNPHYYDNANSEFELPEDVASIAKIVNEGNKNTVTFTRQELSRFPVNGRVKVQIARGVQTFIEEGGKTFLVNGLSHSGWFDVVVYDGDL